MVQPFQRIHTHLREADHANPIGLPTSIIHGRTPRRKPIGVGSANAHRIAATRDDDPILVAAPALMAADVVFSVFSPRGRGAFLQRRVKQGEAPFVGQSSPTERRPRRWRIRDH
jgi:hypothetical protein